METPALLESAIYYGQLPDYTSDDGKNIYFFVNGAKIKESNHYKKVRIIYTAHENQNRNYTADKSLYIEKIEIIPEIENGGPETSQRSLTDAYVRLITPIDTVKMSVSRILNGVNLEYIKKFDKDGLRNKEFSFSLADVEPADTGMDALVAENAGRYYYGSFWQVFMLQLVKSFLNLFTGGDAGAEEQHRA